MKNNILFCTIWIIAFGLTGCQKQSDSTTNTPPPVNAGNFAINLFITTNANQLSPSDNYFISPLSVSLALGMTYNGAAAETQTAMANVLQLNGMSVDQSNQYYQNLMAQLGNADSEVQLNIANSIWHHNSFEVQPSFLSVNQQYFGSTTQSADFRNLATVGLINNWVDDKTNHKIPTILDEIPGDAVMYLINAIYYKAKWKTIFDTLQTYPEPFKLENGSTQDVDMMHVVGGPFSYYQNDILQALDLPYGNGNFSMTVLLPKEGHTVGDIIEAMNADSWDTWINGLTAEDQVILSLPRFKMEYKKNLNQILTDMGMGIAFTDKANFSKINPNVPLQISEVIHKTFVDVNETGTEAAAVTSVGIINTSVPSGTYFKVNKPFVAVIREKTTKSLVFMGKIMKP